MSLHDINKIEICKLILFKIVYLISRRYYFDRMRGVVSYLNMLKRSQNNISLYNNFHTNQSSIQNQSSVTELTELVHSKWTKNEH
jgi:hypothetical protein